MASIPEQIKYLYGQIKCLSVQIEDCCNQVFDFVPYTGADKTVNLNTQQLLVGDITASKLTITVPDVSGAKGISITLGGIGSLNNPDGISIINNGRENVIGLGGIYSFYTSLLNTDNVGYYAALRGQGGTAFTGFIASTSNKEGYIFNAWDEDTDTSLFNVNELGNVTANSFIKLGGLATQYLMADGSVSTGGGGNLPTNLAYVESPTQGTITSSTGTSAIIPLAGQTKAGLISNQAQTIYGEKVIGSSILAFVDSNLFGDIMKIYANSNKWQFSNTVGGKLLDFDNGTISFFQTNLIKGDISNSLLTASRTYQLPNASGTLALISDIPSAQNLQQVSTVGSTVTNTPISFISNDNSGNSALSLSNTNGAGLSSIVSGAETSIFAWNTAPAGNSPGVGKYAIEAISANGIAISALASDGVAAQFTIGNTSIFNIVEFKRNSVNQASISYDGIITSNALVIVNLPATSTSGAGNYDILTRNIITGAVERKPSTFYQEALANIVTGAGTVNRLTKYTGALTIGNTSWKETTVGGRLFNGVDDTFHDLQVTGRVSVTEGINSESTNGNAISGVSVNGLGGYFSSTSFGRVVEVWATNGIAATFDIQSAIAGNDSNIVEFNDNGINQVVISNIGVITSNGIIANGIISSTTSIQVGDNTDIAAVDNVGAIRYRSLAELGYLEVNTQNTFNDYSWKTLWHSGNLTNLNQLTTRNFSDLQNKPTTLLGYGITDTPWTAYLPLTGGILTGALTGTTGTFVSLAQTALGFSFGYANMQLNSTSKFFWSSDGAFSGSKDTALYRPSAGLLRIYDGTTVTNRRDLNLRTLFAETSVVITGGTASQFMKANGTLDSSVYLTSVPAQSFASLTGKPTTLSGYGIIDAIPLTGTAVGSPVTGDIVLNTSIGTRTIGDFIDLSSERSIKFSDDGYTYITAPSGIISLGGNLAEIYVSDGINANYLKQTPTETNFTKPIQVPELQLYDTTNGYTNLYTDNSILVLNNDNTSFNFGFNYITLTSPRTYNLPDANGTLALTSDLVGRYVTEATQTGIVFFNNNRANYGNIGVDAVDFSYSGAASSTRGATGESSFAAGIDNTSSGYNSTTFGYLNVNASVGGFMVGTNSQSAGYVNSILGPGNNVTGTNITVVGQAAEVIAENTASNNIGTSPVFVVGNGTITDNDPDYTVLTRSNAFVVRKNGVIEAPTLTIALIDAGTDKILVTKEWAKKIVVRKISTNTTLANSDNNTVILLTASCTVTLPNGLETGFNCSFATQAGATMTYTLGGSVTLINNSSLIMPPLSSHTLVNTTTANEYLTVGL